MSFHLLLSFYQFCVLFLVFGVKPNFGARSFLTTDPKIKVFSFYSVYYFLYSLLLLFHLFCDLLINSLTST